MKTFRFYRYSCSRPVALLLVSILSGCNSLVEVDPPGTRPSPDLIFQDDLTAVTAVRGVYSEMSSEPYFNNAGISLLTSLSADDMQTLPAGEHRDRMPFEINNISSANPLVKQYCWQPGYRYIYLANSILEGLAASTGVTDTTENQLRAEALFIRAYSTFYLTNLFGSVPLPTTTELSKNLHISRAPSAEAYNFILADLLEAQQLFLLNKDLSFTHDEFRSRASYWAATTFLARVYLYLEKWTEAEQQATVVLDQTSLFALSNDLDSVFLAKSREVIWQLLPVVKDGRPRGPYDAQLFLEKVDEKPVIHFTESFLETIETDDRRFTHWIKTAVVRDTAYLYSNKYQQPDGQDQFHVELRLAELYLIRAEARAHQNNLSMSIDDVDVIRNRANLPLLKGHSFTYDALLQKIAQERRIELFAEGGHRWLDLKRTNEASVTLPPIEYKKWEDTDILYPVPQSEIVSNPNLGPQNLGY